MDTLLYEMKYSAVSMLDSMDYRAGYAIVWGVAVCLIGLWGLKK